jgi:hypothetical protein
MFNLLVPLFALAIPIIAVTGGLTVAVVRTFAQQRVAELAMKERIAAIERGLDPGTLPPLPKVGDPAELEREAASPRQQALRTAQGLQIAAVITGASGLGLAILLAVLPEPREHLLWVLGVVPICVAAGLWVAGGLVQRGAPPEPPAAVPPARA